MYRIIPVEPFDFVLFGATGDLAAKEILPALYRRFRVGQMPQSARVLGISRSHISNDQFRKRAASSIKAVSRSANSGDGHLDRFLKCLEFQRLDARGLDGWKKMSDWLRPTVISSYYLSVGPSVFGDIVSGLDTHGLARTNSRIVIEKPFGQDLASARKLNRIMTSSFDETQIYRIDHYLGKETVQNLMALRFANALFEPLWNSTHIDHIQVTVAETVGVDGRQEYYDRTGAVRDMVQNHLMQLLCLAAMEPPSRFDPDAVRDEKVKVIRALAPVRPEDVIRGQYVSSKPGDSYRDHALTPTSTTESYVALKCRIANWRWATTPFYLRTGKRLRERSSEIAVVFKKPPHSIFEGLKNVQGNVLSIRLQPNEGITMQIMIKEPGPGGMRLAAVPLDMSFAASLGPDVGRLTNAYERLIMDVIRGNQTLFMRSDEVESAWRWTDSIVAGWERDAHNLFDYDVDGDGPTEAGAILHRDNRSWRKLSRAEQPRSAPAYPAPPPVLPAGPA